MAAIAIAVPGSSKSSAARAASHIAARRARCGRASLRSGASHPGTARWGGRTAPVLSRSPPPCRRTIARARLPRPRTAPPRLRARGRHVSDARCRPAAGAAWSRSMRARRRVRSTLGTSAGAHVGGVERAPRAADLAHHDIRDPRRPRRAYAPSTATAPVSSPAVRPGRSSVAAGPPSAWSSAATIAVGTYGPGAQHASELLDDHRLLDEARAVGVHVDPPRLRERAPELGPCLAGRVERGAQGRRGDARLGEAADGLAEVLVFLGDSDRHDALRRSSRRRASPRWPGSGTLARPARSCRRAARPGRGRRRCRRRRDRTRSGAQKLQLPEPMQSSRSIRMSSGTARTLPIIAFDGRPGRNTPGSPRRRRQPATSQKRA